MGPLLTIIPQPVVKCTGSLAIPTPHPPHPLPIGHDAYITGPQHTAKYTGGLSVSWPLACCPPPPPTPQADQPQKMAVPVSKLNPYFFLNWRASRWARGQATGDIGRIKRLLLLSPAAPGCSVLRLARIFVVVSSLLEPRCPDRKPRDLAGRPLRFR